MMSSHAALAAVDNRVSYRQLDYWLRTRRIHIANVSRGSGHHRVWTPVEVAALGEFVTMYEMHRVMSEVLADGSAWQSCLDNQRPHIVRDVTP